MVLNVFGALFVIISLATPLENNMNYDSTGLIVQTTPQPIGDGGDTAGREGDYWFYMGLTNGPDTTGEFQRVLNLLQVSPGIFVRNPNQSPYNIPSDFSGDQAKALIMAMGVNNQGGIVKQFLIHQLKHFTFYPNWDPAGPADIGMYIRALNAWYLYPVLLLTDYAMIVESCIRAEASIGDTSDDINHTLMLLQAQYKYPTPVSWFARKIYKKFRQIQTAWDGYFNPASGANPFNDLYRTLISKM